MKLGDGDGVDRLCWLADGETIDWREEEADGVPDELCSLEDDNEILGLRSFKPLDGESAENRCEPDDGASEVVGTLPVDAFLGVGKPIDSRVLFLNMLPIVLLPVNVCVEEVAGAETSLFELSLVVEA